MDNKNIEVIKLYKSGLSIFAISKKLSISNHTVKNILINNDIKTENRWNTQYTFDKSFFKEINTEEKAYWLGFIIADGYVSKNGDFGIQLMISDKDHLVKFKNSIKSSHPIKEYAYKANIFRKEGLCARFIISSNELIEDLFKLGINTKKTFEVKMPEISINLERHFWRGVIDGDGSLNFGHLKYKNRKYKAFSVELVGNCHILQAFLYFLERELNMIKKMYNHKSIFKVSLSSSKAIKIAKLLYDNSNISLNRKYNKYLQALKMENGRETIYD